MANSLFQLQSPWRTVSWRGSSPDQPLHFVLLARQESDAADLTLIELPAGAGRSAFLAAQIDAEARVFDWFEVQVQTPQTLAQSPAAMCGFLNNAVLDAEWDRNDNENTGETVVFAGDDFGEPWVIDPQKRSITQLLLRKNQAPLRLCRNNEQLRQAGKPAYTDSLQRWFFNEGPPGEISWIELGAQLPNTENELMLEGGAGSRFVEFNSAAGKIRVRRYPLLSLESAIDACREKAAGSEPGKSIRAPAAGNLAVLVAEEVSRFVTRQNAAAGPFSPVAASALETLFQRLSLWKETVQVTADSSRLANRPFLNLGLDAFRLSLNFNEGEASARARSRVKLVRKSDALAVEVEPGNFQFIPCGSGESRRLLERFGGWREGTGTVRFSQVSEASAEVTRVEGVLEGQLLRDLSDATLVWIQLTLEGSSLSFLAHLETEQAGARTGMRFRASISSLTASVAKALKSSQNPRRPCHFSALQPISPAQDIYHLGRIGLRTLLADTDEAVSELEDDLFELASLLPRDSGVAELKTLAATPDLNDRLRRLLSSESWFPDVTGNLIPPDVWLVVLHQLIEFVAIEEHPSTAPSDSPLPQWLRPLWLRRTALEQLATHIEGLLWTPRAVDEEIARVVHRFLPAGG